ncbi:hypothetical protein F4777DRAFT_4627 [Nemania sp. FL0916]|nr:hypothetical protein F4777DRAFT_4627 [Nemania sp. FL0916]
MIQTDAMKDHFTNIPNGAMAKPEERQPKAPKAAGSGKPKTKTALNRPLPCTPATAKGTEKQRAASTSGRINKPVAKLKGIDKSTNIARSKQHAHTKQTIDSLLAGARKWLTAPTTYLIRNPDTGCFGLSHRRAASGERSAITIAHTEDCACLDVRLVHICAHAEKLSKNRLLAHGSRDAFVIATKIRTSRDCIPEDVRFPEVKKQVIRRRREEVDAEDRVVNVVDEYNQQKLTEKWKNLKAYKERVIFKDW